MTLPRPIVADPQFILATRDTGYRGVPAAIAELIDNAVQAGASDVRICVREERPLGRAGTALGRELTIGVLDNGHGMDHDSLWTAVQFGGTERFNDRSGLGRFGMGLPNSSVSVTRRLEVYSWRRPGEVLHTYLDIDEVARRLLRGIPEPEHRPLPLWAAEAAAASGTLVVWPRCDRLDYKKAATVAEKLHAPLGRIYRRLIWHGLRISVNGQPVAPIDPLFCHPETSAGGALAYGAPLSYEVALPDGGRASSIKVRFTELPVAQWHTWTTEEKRAAGVVGGAGVSFVRAGREIDYGWHLFGRKRRENYDDWWRCEVSFEPDLDEYFGVTHSKQGVSPTPYVRSILEPDLEAIARTLNSRVRTAFEATNRTAPSDAAARATRQDHLLPSVSLEVKSAGRRGGLSYAIGLAAIPGRAFFDVTEERGRVLVTINTDHPFYERIYALAAADPSLRQQHAIECLLLAAGRACLSTSHAMRRDWAARYREAWSDALAAFLETKGARL
jgi:hypothetical protein